MQIPAVYRPEVIAQLTQLLRGGVDLPDRAQALCEAVYCVPHLRAREAVKRQHLDERRRRDVRWHLSEEERNRVADLQYELDPLEQGAPRIRRRPLRQEDDHQLQIL